MKKNIPILLASASPRRMELIQYLGIQPHVLATEIDENPLPNETPFDLVSRLSQEKAEAAVLRVLSQPQLKSLSLASVKKTGLLIIAADTIVVSPAVGQRKRVILGKPRSRSEAKKMIRLLSGKTHTVLTGYALLKLIPSADRNRFDSHRIVRVVTTEVQFKKISPAEIQSYVNTGECDDKAGAYGAQGFGMSLIESIQGSYSNVVGLPLSHLSGDLKKILK